MDTALGLQMANIISGNQFWRYRFPAESNHTVTFQSYYLIHSDQFTIGLCVQWRLLLLPWAIGYDVKGVLGR